ncbi:hypothetical protein BNJ_00169 [Kaumoebavirus]|uniref:hypothetical protein n=1 Tax=Kaumoebavirus TaxID=1859492 RepID=UPI0009C23D13|nr:hypothetical protein BNJ_00169 [Kaumoebavirus]ARA72001.1 hypothetical protein BNJ_00169 [Kaumoebavirus]
MHVEVKHAKIKGDVFENTSAIRHNQQLPEGHYFKEINLIIKWKLSRYRSKIRNF